MRKSSWRDEKVWVVGVLARGETVRFMKEIKGCGGASRPPKEEDLCKNARLGRVEEKERTPTHQDGDCW